MPILGIHTDETLKLAILLFASLGCSAAAQKKPLLSVAEAQRQLLQLTVSDDMTPYLPPSVRDGVVKLKQALAAQTDAVITALPAATTVAEVKLHLDKPMPSSVVGHISDDEWRKRNDSDSKEPVASLYGGELNFVVTMPKLSLLLIQERFDIECGTDNILLVYSNEKGTWKRTLLWESKPYTSIGEAFGDSYETLLLGPQHNGHPLLLVLHGHPWCTSTMSAFSMDVFELGASSNSIPFWHAEHGYRRLDLDPPLTVRATGDGFEVHTSVSTTGERVTHKGVVDAVVSRKGVMRYAVTADGIHRVQPIAMNAHDSAEEWLEMPKTEATEFADEPAGSLTWTMFQQFTDGDKPFDPRRPFPSVGAVRACKDKMFHFQVDVTSADLDSGRPGPAYFVQLRQVPNGYRIHAVTLKKDPACDGPDLMAP